MAVIPNSMMDRSEIDPGECPEGSKLPAIAFSFAAVERSLEENYQGIDKVMALAQRLKGRVVFHMFGEMPRDQRQEGGHLVFHGFLTQQDYLQRLAACDVGLGTAALHRKRMGGGLSPEGEGLPECRIAGHFALQGDGIPRCGLSLVGDGVARTRRTIWIGMPMRLRSSQPA